MKRRKEEKKEEPRTNIYSRIEQTRVITVGSIIRKEERTAESRKKGEKEIKYKLNTTKYLVE
jgi:hypothetical protein